jgi:hypothetical protein
MPTDDGLTFEQREAVYAAYLGICVLKRMVHKQQLQLATARSNELLKELGDAFPFIGERVALSALRVG